MTFLIYYFTIIIMFIVIYIYISRGITKNKEQSAKNGSEVVLPRKLDANHKL